MGENGGIREHLCRSSRVLIMGFYSTTTLNKIRGAGNITLLAPKMTAAAQLQLYYSPGVVVAWISNEREALTSPLQ